MTEKPDTRTLESVPIVTAPDGSAVRPLCQLANVGSFAHFQLAAGEIARAVSHATVQEIWYVIAGAGRMWRQQADDEPTVMDLRPGVCLTIPIGTAFQFRADGVGTALEIVAATMPPWPQHDEDEARPEQGPWIPTF